MGIRNLLHSSLTCSILAFHLTLTNTAIPLLLCKNEQGFQFLLFISIRNSLCNKRYGSLSPFPPCSHHFLTFPCHWVAVCLGLKGLFCCIQVSKIVSKIVDMLLVRHWEYYKESHVRYNFRIYSQLCMILEKMFSYFMIQMWGNSLNWSKVTILNCIGDKGLCKNRRLNVRDSVGTRSGRELGTRRGNIKFPR